MRLVLRWLPVVLVAVTVVPRPAAGQTKGATPPAGDSAQAKAAVAQQEVEAGKHYRAGVAAEKRGDWKGAYEEYARAYALFQHPQVLVSLGVAEHRLGRHRAAAEHLTLFLADPPAGLPARERAEYTGYLADAKKHVGTLKVFADAGAEVMVNAAPVGVVPATGSLEVFVEPGKPLVVARLGQTEGRHEVDVLPGKGSEVHLTLHAKAVPPTSGTPAAPVSAVARGTVAVAAGTAAPAGAPAVPSNRRAVLTGGVALAALGVGVSVGAGVASFAVGRDADDLANDVRRAGGSGACRGVSTGDCGDLRDLRGQQSALINTAIMSAVGTVVVGVATGIYAHATRAKATPTTGTIVLPVVGQSAGGFAVVGTF